MSRTTTGRSDRVVRTSHFALLASRFAFNFRFVYFDARPSQTGLFRGGTSRALTAHVPQAVRRFTDLRAGVIRRHPRETTPPPASGGDVARTWVFGRSDTIPHTNPSDHVLVSVGLPDTPVNVVWRMLRAGSAGIGKGRGRPLGKED